MRWAFDRLDSEGAIRDVVVLVDADTSTGRGLLRAFDRRFAAGAVAAQAYYAVRDPAATPAVAMRAAALAVRHYLRPLARCSLGGTCGLFGNGMGFRADVLPRPRQLSGHLTEDLELQLELILGGDVIEFVPEAVVEAEMPSTVAARAHRRTNGGRAGGSTSTRRYVPRLVRSALGRRAQRRFTKLDTAVDLVLPPFSVLVAATAASTRDCPRWRAERPSRSHDRRRRDRQRRGASGPRALGAPDGARAGGRVPRARDRTGRRRVEGGTVDARTVGPNRRRLDQDGTEPGMNTHRIATILGVPVDDVTMDEAVDRIAAMVEDGRTIGSRPPDRDRQRGLPLQCRRRRSV